MGSKLDPFKAEIHRLLGGEPAMTGQRIRELLAPLGFEGGKTIVDDYVREVRPLFAVPRTYQRTVYRTGEVCQFDLLIVDEVGYCSSRAATSAPLSS